MAKTAVLKLLDSLKLISRKVWMTEKSWNFHTVNWIESESIKKCTLSGSNSEEKESPDQKEERNGNE